MIIDLWMWVQRNHSILKISIWYLKISAKNDLFHNALLFSNSNYRNNFSIIKGYGHFNDGNRLIF